MTVKEATPRQEEILDRAFELVRESGLASLTMKKVAERVGFTEPAVYRHFPTKQALVLGLLARLSGLLLVPIRAIAAEGMLPPVERLSRILSHHLGLIIDTDGLPFLILAEASAAGDEVVIGRMREIIGELRLILIGIVEEMPSTPDSPPPPILVMSLFGLVASTAIQRRMMPDVGFPREVMLAQIPVLVRRITGWKEGGE
ncbi:MAG TPA: TetR/AcrR family transcriptional regulator [Thermoanaerobaculia bacterium]|nr:TetR/AcrR family transcriptional regulator [Thermoanaerobaculia bacterium]